MKENNRKILFLNKTHSFLEEKLQELGFECYFDLKSSKAAIEKKIPEYVGLVIRSRIKLDAQFFDQAINLTFVARAGVGVEHIDMKYAEEKGIRVFTSPEGSMYTVAEHTMGMMLMLLNHLSRADHQIRNGQWLREPNRGIEIKGKTIGILGYGNMGREVAKRLSGFGAKVIAYDKYKQYYEDEYVKEVGLEALFADTDILTIHIFYEPENHYFIDNDFIQQFGKDIFIINTARGLVLNTSDLVKNLKSGKVRGAALDVIEYEEQAFELFDFSKPPEAFQYLLKAENVVLSPHIAGWSFESREGHARVLGEKIEAFVKLNFKK